MKEIIVTKAELNLKKEVERKFLYKKLTLDSSDRVIDDTEFNYKGAPIHRITYRYSPFDNISERIEFDASNNLIERHLYQEDENGEITSSTIEYGNGTKTIKNYEFTDLGNADKATLLNETGEIIGYETYVLDNDSRLISEFESDEEHNELFKINREFDLEGNVIREIEFVQSEINLVTSNHYKNGQLTKVQRGKDMDSFYSTEIRELDSKNRLVKRTTNFHDYGDVEIELLEYDSKDNVISNVVSVNGRTIFTNVCIYDLSNRLVEEYVMELDLNGSINKHERLFHEYND